MNVIQGTVIESETIAMSTVKGRRRFVVKHLLAAGAAVAATVVIIKIANNMESEETDTDSE